MWVVIGQEFFEAVDGMAGDALEQTGEVGPGIESCAAGAFDEGEEDRRGLASAGASGEEPVLAAHGDGADGALDGVVVDGKAAVLCIGNEFGPVVERVADGLSQRGFWEHVEALVHPGAKLGENGCAPFLAQGLARRACEFALTGFALDVVKTADDGDGGFGARVSGAGGLDEFAPRVRPAPRVAALGSAIVLQRCIDGVVVAHEPAGKVAEHFPRAVAPAGLSKINDGVRRVFVAVIDPQVAFPCRAFFPSGIEHPDGSLVGADHLRALAKAPLHQVDQRREQIGQLHQPAAGLSPRQVNARALEHALLPAQRQVVGVLGDEEVGEQRRVRGGARQRHLRQRGLRDGVLAVAAGVARANILLHEEARGNERRLLRHVLADALHLPPAAGAGLFLRRKVAENFLARKFLRQRPPRRRAALAPWRGHLLADFLGSRLALEHVKLRRRPHRRAPLRLPSEEKMLELRDQRLLLREQSVLRRERFPQHGNRRLRVLKLRQKLVESHAHNVYTSIRQGQDKSVSTSAIPHPVQRQPAHQEMERGLADCDLAAPRRGEGEAALFQPLVPQRKAVSIPVEHLHPVAAPVAKEKQVTRHRILAQLLTRHCGEAIERLPHVRRREAHKDPDRRRERQHPRAAATTVRTSSAGAPAWTRTTAPEGSATSTSAPAKPAPRDTTSGGCATTSSANGAGGSGAARRFLHARNLHYARPSRRQNSAAQSPLSEHRRKTSSRSRQTKSETPRIARLHRKWKTPLMHNTTAQINMGQAGRVRRSNAAASFSPSDPLILPRLGDHAPKRMCEKSWTLPSWTLPFVL